MDNSKLLWRGKSKKYHFHSYDIMSIVVALFALGMQLKIFTEWTGKIEEYFMCIFLISIIFYESIGKFIIRFYYVKKASYELYTDKLVIKMKVFGWDYIRQFNLKDISSMKMIKYKTGSGSIHFGDAETRFWTRHFFKPAGYEGLRDDIDICVSTIGLLRPKNKWNSGIIYNINQVEKVFYLLNNFK